jgi:hypothetical protein
MCSVRKMMHIAFIFIVVLGTVEFICAMTEHFFWTSSILRQTSCMRIRLFQSLIQRVSQTIFLYSQKISTHACVDQKTKKRNIKKRGTLTSLHLSYLKLNYVMYLLFQLLNNRLNF